MKTITLLDFAVGEIYSGIVLAADGTLSHHLILLPGDADAAPHQAQVDWADSIGGDLPMRQEQALLFANAKQHFHRDCYWSGEQESEFEWAWFTHFTSGHQDNIPTDYACRARAVRRLFISESRAGADLRKPKEMTRSDAMVLLVEGEKCADAAARYGGCQLARRWQCTLNKSHRHHGARVPGERCPRQGDAPDGSDRAPAGCRAADSTRQ